MKRITSTCIPSLRPSRRRTRAAAGLGAALTIPALLIVTGPIAHSASAAASLGQVQIAAPNVCITPPPGVPGPPCPATPSPSLPPHTLPPTLPPTPQPTIPPTLPPTPPPAPDFLGLDCPVQDFPCDPTLVDPTQIGDAQEQQALFDWIAALDQWINSFL